MICVVGDIIMNKTDVIKKLVTVKKYKKENVYNAEVIIKYLKTNCVFNQRKWLDFKFKKRTVKKKLKENYSKYRNKIF